MKTVAQRFLDFQEQVISPDAPPIQIGETRRAFYAGAKAMLDAGLELAELDQCIAVIALEALHIECRRFGQQH
jgi:hypothetical protein